MQFHVHRFICADHEKLKLTFKYIFKIILDFYNQKGTFYFCLFKRHLSSRKKRIA